MRCERCQGSGYSELATPCDDCNGLGITHCCDGLCEQPATKMPKVPCAWYCGDDNCTCGMKDLYENKGDK